LVPKTHGTLCPDLDKLESEFRDGGSRLLVFSHPNNPTGAVYSKTDLEKIASLANAYNALIVVDELYSRLIHDGCKFNHLVAEPGMVERTITLLGPSKTESLSGYRLGVVVAPAAIIDAIEDVLSLMALRAPAYAQHLLVHWLRDDKQWLAERLPQFSGLRQLTAQHFKSLPWAKWTPQAGTAYAWLNVSALGLADHEVARSLLKDAGALVSPGYQFGPSGYGNFRVCYARDEEEWDKALQRMIDVLGTLWVETKAPL
jgi:aspartate/methionine/tyrosine aminotransferase